MFGRFVVERREVVYRLGGVDPDEGVDVYDLVKYLSKFDDLVRVTVREAGYDGELKIKVRPFKEGSFITEFIVESGIVDFLTSANVDAVLKAIEILGFCYGGAKSIPKVVRKVRGAVDRFKDNGDGSYTYGKGDDAVTVDEATSYHSQLGALPNPSVEHAKPCSQQQGAGFVVTKSDEKKETACVEFLKWFTAKEQNTDFSVSAGYVPVTKDALTLENLQAAAESIDGASGNYLVNLPATLDTIEAGVYANPPFKGGVEARAVLDRALSDRAVADRAAVVEAMAAGASSEEAVAPYLDDAGFDAWLADLETQLREAIA